ncbi:unnamed protein product [Parnassius mnemosyne]|uniref:26S proteasome non-ATPase regulatory subunit 5 n=1 Tax=Parnassius mnemosyne TaxID=213953 RepID=A0AAV1LU22_9NEOP
MSSQDLEQFRIFNKKLETEKDIKPILNAIKSLFDYKPAAEAKITLSNVGISNIVRCLNVQDKSNDDLTCEVLKICFEKFGVGDVVKHFTSHIMYLLRHEKNCVRRLAVDEVYKSVIADVSLLPVPEYIDIFVAVAQMVCDKDVGVANKAIIITSNLQFEAYPKVLEEMKIALEHNSSSKCNAYEVVINISLKSYELFKLSVDNGYIEHMVEELKSNDVLYQLNILELLSRLSVKPYGINYLVKDGALERITALIGDLRNNPLGGLLLPGYIKFFASIAHYYPKEIFEKYPIFLNSLFNAIESGEQTVLPVALDALGFIGITIEGKLCLTAVGSPFIQAIEKIGQLIRNSPAEIKIRALYCYASLISVEKDTPSQGPVDHRVTLMTREWFRSLNKESDAMETLLGICKIPFPDIKLAAYSLLDAVCQHLWGEELVARVAGFVEFLLDRSINEPKEAKEAKYDIIKRLSQSSVFDDNILTRFKTYVKEGPFYSDTTLQVAMEEGN